MQVKTSQCGKCRKRVCRGTSHWASSRARLAAIFSSKFFGASLARHFHIGGGGRGMAETRLDGSPQAKKSYSLDSVFRRRHLPDDSSRFCIAMGFRELQCLGEGFSFPNGFVAGCLGKAAEDRHPRKR